MQFQTPAVTLFDAMVAYEEEHWRWSINASNLEDKEYMVTCLARGDCFVGQARHDHHRPHLQVLTSSLG